MIRNCQQFEQRLQHLMDLRIDPETDQFLCAHASQCRDCMESLMAFSVLHTNFLHDSDSMKIKLADLGLQDLATRHKKSRQSGRARFVAVAHSLAALILLACALMMTGLVRNGHNVSVARVDQSVLNEPVSVSAEDAGGIGDNLFSLVRFRKQLNDLDFYGYSSEFPGVWQIKSLSGCLDWFQKSWLKPQNREEVNPDFGRNRGPGWDYRYSEQMTLCCNA